MYCSFDVLQFGEKHTCQPALHESGMKISKNGGIIDGLHFWNLKCVFNYIVNKYLFDIHIQLTCILFKHLI